ncbi:hypothetical protein [Parasphingorhabdus sp.]|uniref:hypothetical protein n=1 Tax=Parasphingorhabdus sp. TaxID=2709688 RepID=UPI003A95B986
MNKYYEAIQTNGGYGPSRAQVLDASNEVVAVYADDSGTRFTDDDGAALDYAPSDNIGMVEFYWSAAAGQTLKIMDHRGNFCRSIPDFAANYILDNLGGSISQSQVTGLSDVLGEQGAAVADATDAASAITQLNALLDRCRDHGLIAA